MLFAALAIILLLIGLFAVLGFNNMQKPFYVGVTYGGSNSAYPVTGLHRQIYYWNQTG